jgi:hypothetical protein
MNEWLRQPGESAKDYDLFLKFRDIPPAERSLKELARRLNRHVSVLHRKYARWNWVGRSDQWDAEMQRLIDNKIKTTALESHNQQLTAAKGYFALCITAMQKLQAKMSKDDFNVSLLQMGASLKLCIEMLRTLMGTNISGGMMQELEKLNEQQAEEQAVKKAGAESTDVDQLAAILALMEETGVFAVRGTTDGVRPDGQS